MSHSSLIALKTKEIRDEIINIESELLWMDERRQNFLIIYSFEVTVQPTEIKAI